MKRVNGLTFFQRLGYHVPWVTRSGDVNWGAVIGDVLFALCILGAAFILHMALIAPMVGVH